MAKAGEPSLLTQHIEKVVLGLCAALFVFVLAFWVVSGSREMDGTPPDQIDRKLLSEAKALRDQSEAVTAPEPKKTDYLADLSAARDGTLVDPMETAGICCACPLPAIRTYGADGSVEPLGIADLTPLPVPGKPKFWAGWELPSKGGQQYTDDEVTVHVVAVFPWSELVKQWNAAIQNPRIPMRIVALGVRAEVQEMIRQGVWTEPRPVEMTTAGIVDERGNPIAFPVIPQYNGANSPEVSAAITELSSDYWQEMILQPDYHDIYLPAAKQWGSWMAHLPETEVSKPASDETVQASTPKAAGPAARATRRTGDWTRAGGDDWNRGRGPDDWNRGPADWDARRTPTAGSTRQRSTARSARDDTSGVPDLESQRQSGKVLIWFHDNSLEPMKVYRYRVQVTLLNPLYTYDREVKDPKVDSREVAIMSEFSEWSDSVFVPTTTEFFVTGGFNRSNTVNVKVFAQRLGQRIARRFSVSEGQAIGEPKSVKVTNPTTGQQELREVPFDTGAIAVDLDFNKQVYVGGRNLRTTIELVYLDKDGQLKSAIQNFDASSERLKELVEETKQAAPPPPTPKVTQARRATTPKQTTRSRRVQRTGRTRDWNRGRDDWDRPGDDWRR